MSKFLPALSVIVLLLSIWVAAPAQAQTDPPLPPFPDFKQALEKTLMDKGFDPQHQTFHFVILMDNASNPDVTGTAIDAIISGMLEHYLVADSSASDMVSYAPFQLQLVPNHDHWDLPYTPENAKTIKNAIPLGPIQEGAYIGGNDKERALIEALKSVKKEGSDPGKAIYIVLSDNIGSQPPGAPKGQSAPNYTLAYKTPDFEIALPYGMADILPYTSLMTPKPNPQPIFYRIYLPTGLTPLGTLTGTSRDDILAHPPLVALPVVPPVVPPGGTNNGPPKPPPPPPPPPVGAILGGLCALLVIGGGLGYYLWLAAPRNVQVGPAIDRVRYGTPMFVVAQDDQLTLTRKPTGTRVARLEVAPNGDVVMRGEGFYVLPKSKVIVTPAGKTYWLKDNRTGVDTYEINARRVR